MTIVFDAKSESLVLLRDREIEAKQATEQLTQSFQKFNTTATAGFTATGVKIGDLKGELAALQAKIEQTDIADKARLDSLRARYKEIQDLIKGQNEQMAQTQKATEGINQSLGSLYTTIRTVITAGLIKETISATLEMAKLAGQVDGVKRAFDKLPNSVLLMEELKQKTHGTLDELTLMQKAVQAQNFKIPLEQLGTLLEFVAIKSQQTGLDINYLTDSIITGLGRGSLKILDNLQISITELKEKTKELGSQQAAVFFLVNQQLKTMGGYVENSGTSVKQLESDWRNLGITIAKAGEGFANFFVKQMDESVKSIGIAVRAFSIFGNISPGSLKAIVEMDRMTKEATDNVLLFKKAHEGNIEAVDKEIKRLDELNIRERLSIIQAQAEGKKGEEGQTEAIERGIGIRKTQITLLKEYKDTLELAALEQKKQVGLIEAIDEKIKDLNEELVKTTSQKRIIQIQVEIKQLESQRLDLLDPERASRQAKETYDKINKEIAQAVREGSPKVLQEVNKQVDAYNKELVKGSQKEMKQFIDGLKLAMKEAEKEENEQERRRRRLMGFIGQQLFTNARQIANELVQQEVAEYDERIQNLHNFYSQQESLAGNNTKAIERLKKEEAKQQKQLEKERKEAQKKANIERIEIDTAANVIRSILENGGVPWGLPFGAIAAAMGLVQIAFVNKFAEGVIDLKGPGTTTSDSIPSMLSRGESVMTAEETRGSMNILKGIRAKKLNDQILEKLTVTTDGIVAKMDLDPLINEYRKSKAPDLVRQFGTIYEAKEIGKNTKRIIRSKSFTN